MRDLGPIRIISVLLQLSWRKSICSQDFILELQVVKVRRVAGVMDLVDRYN